MKIRESLFTGKHIVPLFVVAVATMGCGGKAGSGSSVGNIEDAAQRVIDLNANPPQLHLVEPGVSAKAATQAGAAKGTNTVPAGAAGQADAAAIGGTADHYDALGKLDPNGSYDRSGSLLPGVVLTPVQERTDAMARMNGIKATLMAELDQVRARLKAGKQAKEAADSDKQRAAELGQGLERVNRTLKAMGGATDATWAQMREAQLKEVGEVRDWWNKYMAGRNAEAKQ
ncbi:MAG: hypothetical protein JST98_00540 [Bacteroidetes bacterium]|nr:hypothetical protein [Bacteroidota bacterium]